MFEEIVLVMAIAFFFIAAIFSTYNLAKIALSALLYSLLWFSLSGLSYISYKFMRARRKEREAQKVPK